MKSSVQLGRIKEIKYVKNNISSSFINSFNIFSSISCKNDIIYWMSRDQRVEDNWGLLFSRDLSKYYSVGIKVIFNLVPSFLDATERHYDFMLKGLKEVELKLRKKNIPFYVLLGNPKDSIPSFISKYNSSILITDFSPLRISKLWINDITKYIHKNTKIFTIDSHNIIPVWITSDKQEYAARTIRPKINKKKEEYLIEIPKLNGLEDSEDNLPNLIDWDTLNSKLKINRSIKPIKYIKPGSNEAFKTLDDFCSNKLESYADLRNKPMSNVLSNLSPYIHFGQISTQRIVLEVQKIAQNNPKLSNSADSFIEEVFVRRELSENYCYYQENYDNIKGANEWAKKSLEIHKEDKREYIYSLNEFENGKTHSSFWNAMQYQLVNTGKLHGFCRMMWAKNILEWASSPEEALKISIYLNDKYSIDGRDPNGYVGCMWSITGLHDQGWKERPVFGKVRYMNEAGCRRKFNVDEYINYYSNNAKLTDIFKVDKEESLDKPKKKKQKKE